MNTDPLANARGKFGEDLKKGDRVAFVHFGEAHEAIVDAIEQGPGDIKTVVASVVARVPSGAVMLIEHAADIHKDTHKESTKSPAGASEKPTESKSTPDAPKVAEKGKK